MRFCAGMLVFIDTSYFFTRLVVSEWRERANRAARPGLRAVTSSLVIKR